ncbi:MAG: DUF4153 domain-containing protein [Clostridiales bacterium]|nr:DUF4153 domain-containing protein [Clostridiales bacterium]
MGRIKGTFQLLTKSLLRAVLRFPVTVLCLVAAEILICYLISLHSTPPLITQKLIFTFLVGAVLSMATQFALERFDHIKKFYFLIYGLAILLTAGYFLILWPAPEISAEIGIRTFVAVFAMICAVLWFPSYKGKTDFNKVALIHFKSVFTSLLYAAVLSAGVAAIIAAIDILLFKINNDTYSYAMSVIWVLFATIYYLSLLPVFSSEEEYVVAVMQRAEKYPKFLEILISYIAIPLVTAYTMVLFAYFIKILVTMHWPSGQLGPMVLAYSAAGLLIFVLSSLLENRFATAYHKIFPKVLIPVVIMQLISVGIRLNAYGVTESRYYVVLFRIFSITVGILLSVKPLIRNSIIALLAAGFAIFSIIPPVDAFTVSRNSQIGRVETILQSEGILKGGKLTPKENASEKTRIEITNILSYLNSRSSLKYIKWLPKDFNIYEDMQKTFGFEPAYPSYGGNPGKYYNASVDTNMPVNISGYDISVLINSDRYSKDTGSNINFKVRNIDYQLSVKRINNEDARISIKNTAGTELIGTGLYEFVKGFSSTGNLEKNIMPPEKMTLDVTKNGYKLRIVFQYLSVTSGTGTDDGADYSALVMFGAP